MKNNQTEIKTLMDSEQAAKVLNLSKRTLEAFRVRGNGPKYVKISARCVRYRLDDLNKWINERITTSTSEN
jgi:predicted DNA-binding transcriptional regulator AlpA